MVKIIFFRKDVYLTNLEFIKKHNAKSLSYKLDENQFTDMTLEEYQTRLGLKTRESRILNQRKRHINKRQAIPSSFGNSTY